MECTKKNSLEAQASKLCSRITKFFEILVRLAGIEPTTPWFVAKYSIQLSYSREAVDCSTGFWALSSILKKSQKSPKKCTSVFIGL
jgi:hypothetical protein